jgi:peptidyl-prolyl cis-trans isomerase D
MIGTLRKHQQWLWMIIITVTIISFVVFFSPDAKWKGAFSRDNRKYYNGKPVTINGQPITNDEYQKALRETYLASFMRTGGREWPASDEQTQKQLEINAIYRVFLIKKMHDLDIHVSDKAVAQAAEARLGGLGLNRFAQEVLSKGGLTIVDFENYLRNDLAIQQVLNTAAVSGKLYNAQDAENLFRKEQEQNDAQLAVFWASNFMDKVTVTEADLANYYNLHISSYRLPDRMVVKYLEFPLSNYLAAADKELAKQTNVNAAVDEYYYKQGTNAFKGTNGAVLSEADAKKKIMEGFRENLAMLEARKKANDIGSQIYDLNHQEQSTNAATLDAVAKTNGLTVKISPPLELYGTNEAEFSSAFRQAAFRLTPTNQIFFNPVPGENGYYILALNKKIASETQPFEKVKDRVMQDCKHTKAVEAARVAGMAFYNSVTNGLAQKKSWDDLTAQAHVATIQVPPFSQASSASTFTNLDERIRLSTLQGIAEKMKPGQVSPFEPTPMMSPEGGFVLYLKDKKQVDEATFRKEFPEYLARMRAYRQNDAFNQWFRKQAEQSKLFIEQRAPSTEISGG